MISITIASGATASIHLAPQDGHPIASTLEQFSAIGLPITAANTTAGAATPKPPAMGEYWAGQGGILVATIPTMLGMPARHVIASQAEASLTFGPRTDVSTAASHVDGAANTTALINHPDNHPAAEWAASYTADGHTDFYLPARFELIMAHLQAPQAFKEGWHWTSTQGDRGYAFAQVFSSGSSYWHGKDFEFRVRAVRMIQLHHSNP